MSRFALLLTCLLIPCLAACGPTVRDDDDAAPVDFRIWSDDHVSADTLDNNPHDCEVALPPEFSCFNESPEISWEGAPEGTVAFALIFDDPTAGNFPHWAIFNIPGDATGLDRGISGQGGSGIPDGSTELSNGANQSSYLGSCPQAGFVNEYSWRLYALDAELDTAATATFGELENDAEDAEIEMVSMCHVFDGSNSDI
ncbi:MAG: YbhB/YbcL family Raf kinase inhibitor-like protein [Proteobacteria bacterium]|nr:YbhB/YbcL family Raf kinase inhibitor-like protein [Pseudomonadota bacterium]